jgi:hypothetical protein
MRYLAYVMFILGFFWICICQFEIPPIARAVMLEQCSKIPKQESYKVEDVRGAIHDAVADMSDRVPLFCIGGCVMLLGAMILDRAKRPK